ncbi:hypothetical protein ACJMK2_023595 [Sinanodonta woodiana]|uniref:Maturase K n=1 Tax=Sinanodonta woodiana TaxID=1069815 RepID=A0ABD3T5J9_SINWO
MDRSRLCRFYFHLGLIYSEIPNFQTLKRILRTLYLFKRRFHYDVLELAQFIEENVSNSCNQQGYHTVGILIQLLDPAYIPLRLRRRLRRRQYLGQGPDYIWHVDFTKN